MKHNQAYLDYRSTLPRNGRGVIWTIESFSKAVTLLAPGFVVEDGQEYQGVKKPLWLVCPTHGGFQVISENFLTETHGNGCAKCSQEAQVLSKRSKRKRLSNEAEKQKARELYADSQNYSLVAKLLNRSLSTIQSWCDPKQAQKHRDRSIGKSTSLTDEAKEWRRARAREFSRTPEGRVYFNSRQALRRKRKRGEVEWCDEIAGLVNLLPVKATGSELTKEQAYYIECERLTKETGVQHHVDHIWPLSQGGPHVFYNLQVLTAEENLKKGGKYRPEDKALYAMRIGMLFAPSFN
ncbi:HNH endonuclease [bacterium]|nr:HNH endonuclease [bacterium]